MTKWVYLFSEANADTCDLLGTKGAYLAQAASVGLPVSPGFIITTDACREYYGLGPAGTDGDRHNRLDEIMAQAASGTRVAGTLPDAVWQQAQEAIKAVEVQAGKRFGDASNPLLVSVRPAPPRSMPGLMDAVIDVGLSDQTVAGLAHLANDEQFAYLTYGRFVQRFGRVVKGMDGSKFERVLSKYKEQPGQLVPGTFGKIVPAVKKVFARLAGVPFPQDPYDQLRSCIEAALASWFSERTVSYRAANELSHEPALTVVVTAVVHGNLGEDSGVGIAFTRDPRNGQKGLCGEYLANAQYHDRLAGVRRPEDIAALQARQPAVYQRLQNIGAALEKHYGDMHAIEFTVERGRLYVNFATSARRTPIAAVKVAVDMANEGLITRAEAVRRVMPEQASDCLLPCFDPDERQKALREGALLARGQGASPGTASGAVVFDSDTAESMGRAGEAVILVRPKLAPDDVHGMLSAQGVLTHGGSPYSNAAVVAHDLSIPYVSGCEAADIDIEARHLTVGGRTIEEGDEISIDGTTGEVFAGLLRVTRPLPLQDSNLPVLLGWAEEIARIQVWANADSPRDIQAARRVGARGIGFCRMEHMLFDVETRPWMQQMIFNAVKAQVALDRSRQAELVLASRPKDAHLRGIVREASKSPAIKAYQQALSRLGLRLRHEFESLFEAADGLPLVVRLLSVPLQEYLPSLDLLARDVADLYARLDVLSRAKGYQPRQGEKSIEQLQAELQEKLVERDAASAMHQFNPLLGVRGIRQGIFYPGLSEMQVRAIVEAACRCARRGIAVDPRILIPTVMDANEFKSVRGKLEEIAGSVIAGQGVGVAVSFGALIEVPRAAVTAGDIAKCADFLVIGGNTLTQLTYGLCRDDVAGSLWTRYLVDKLLPHDPFGVLDDRGVGRLIALCVEEARRATPGIEISLVGEQASELASIKWCDQAGLDYVSCSPWRLPMARIAAGQAAVAAQAASESEA
jgi:pyruvate,orthophosphate dikinase